MWDCFLEEMSPFKDQTLTVRDTSAQRRVLEEGRGVSLARHFWVSPGHEVRPLLPHVAQLPDSRPYLRSVSACFCYHGSMRIVPWWWLGWEFPECQLGSMQASQPWYGTRKGRQDTSLQTVTGKPFSTRQEREGLRGHPQWGYILEAGWEEGDGYEKTGILELKFNSSGLKSSILVVF